MRLLADENFPFPVVVALRSFGYDVLTLSDLGKAGQALTDLAVLKLVSDDSRAVLTLNRKHFVRLWTRVQITPGLSSAPSISILTAKLREFEQRLAHSRHLLASFCGSTAWAESCVQRRSGGVILRELLGRVKGPLATLAAPRGYVAPLTRPALLPRAGSGRSDRSFRLIHSESWLPGEPRSNSLAV
jgi:hypothetical protein